LKKHKKYRFSKITRAYNEYTVIATREVLENAFYVFSILWFGPFG